MTKKLGFGIILLVILMAICIPTFTAAQAASLPTDYGIYAVEKNGTIKTIPVISSEDDFSKSVEYWNTNNPGVNFIVYDNKIERIRLSKANDMQTAIDIAACTIVYESQYLDLKITKSPINGNSTMLLIKPRKNLVPGIYVFRIDHSHDAESTIFKIK